MLVNRIFSYLAAVLAAHVLSTVTGAQIILAEIQGFGLEVSLADRISASFHDVISLATTLPLLIAPAFLVGFVIAWAGARFVGGRRDLWVMAAGLSSLPAGLLVLRSMLGAAPFAAARTGTGLVLMALCGLAGGWVYARMTREGPA